MRGGQTSTSFIVGALPLSGSQAPLLFVRGALLGAAATCGTEIRKNARHIHDGKYRVLLGWRRRAPRHYAPPTPSPPARSQDARRALAHWHSGHCWANRHPAVSALHLPPAARLSRSRLCGLFNKALGARGYNATICRRGKGERESPDPRGLMKRKHGGSFLPSFTSRSGAHQWRRWSCCFSPRPACAPAADWPAALSSQGGATS